MVFLTSHPYVSLWERIINKVIPSSASFTNTIEPSLLLPTNIRVIGVKGTDDESLYQRICGTHWEDHDTDTYYDDRSTTSTAATLSLQISTLIQNIVANHSVPSSNESALTYIVLCETTKVIKPQSSSQPPDHQYHRQYQPPPLQFVSDGIAIYNHPSLSLLLSSSSSSTTDDQVIEHNFATTFGPFLHPYVSHEPIKATQQQQRQSYHAIPMPALSSTIINASNKIYITLLFDRAVLHWKDYLHHIRTYIDSTNEQRHQQQNVVGLLSTLCPNIYPLELMDILRTDTIRNIAVKTPNTENDNIMNYSNAHHPDHHQHRYISTTDNNIETLLSGYVGENAQHIILYIPQETTYFMTTSHNASPPTVSALVQVFTGAEALDGNTTIHTASYFGIINHNDIVSLSSVLDQLYDQYYWKCLNVIHSVPTASMFTMTSFYMKIYFHRNFYIWYSSILDRLECVLAEMVDLQTSHSNYVVATWSLNSLLIPAQHKFHKIISHITDLSSLWLYITNYDDVYQRLHDLDESVQTLVNDVHSMKRIAKQNKSRIIDLDVLTHDMPVEQYMAIFGP
jgi:hypothetical protein